MTETTSTYSDGAPLPKGYVRTTSKTEARRLMRGRRVHVLVSGSETWVPTTQEAVLQLIEPPEPCPSYPRFAFAGRGIELDLSHDGNAYADWYELGT